MYYHNLYALHITGLVQNRSISTDNTMEILQSYTKLVIYEGRENMH